MGSENKVTEFVDGLSVAERQQALTLLAYQTRPSATEFSDDELLVWHEINKIMQSTRPIARFFESGNVSRMNYADDVEELMTFITRGCRAPLKKVERQALIHITLSCLVRFLEKAGAPIAHRTLVMNLEKAMSAVNRAFPGYAQAGLLGLAMRPVVAA